MSTGSAHRDSSSGAIDIAYQVADTVVGAPDGEPLLLIAGTAGQLFYWHDDFCAALVEAGFTVARFDNRDSGLSTHLTGAGTPSLLAMGLLAMLTRPGPPRRTASKTWPTTPSPSWTPSAGIAHT